MFLQNTLLVYFNVSDVSRKILVKSCCRTCRRVHIYGILHQRHSTFKGNGILATRAAVIYRAGVCQSTSKRLLSKRTASAAFTVKRSRSPKTLTVYTFYQISSSLRVVVRQNVDISICVATEQSDTYINVWYLRGKMQNRMCTERKKNGVCLNRVTEKKSLN